jgi:hypothetical protein
MNTGLSGRSSRPAACARHRPAGDVAALADAEAAGAVLEAAGSEAEAGGGDEARGVSAASAGVAGWATTAGCVVAAGWEASGFAFERFEPNARP